jgi:hypothetical protein
LGGGRAPLGAAPVDAPHKTPIDWGPLSILRIDTAMKGLVWIVVVVGLAALLDSYFNQGFYTQALIRMLSDIGGRMR